MIGVFKLRIVIAGGSGLIGQKLVDLFQMSGHEIIILSRKTRAGEGKTSYVKWLADDTFPEIEINQADVFINLAGVSINDGRWNAQHQKNIYDSRMTATDELLRIIKALPVKPSVLINASAIGIYPASEENIYTEQSTEVATDFLAKTVFDWEQKALSAESDGIRAVCMRFGVVLSNDGGALPPMVLPYKLFAGGTVGSGEQWLSWIHLDDVARAILFAIENDNLHGPVNVTSPFPKRMKYVGQSIGSVLRRPHWFPVPSFVMRLALGKKSMLVLKGQHVLPQVLLDNNFTFSFPSIELALEDLLDNDV